MASQALEDIFDAYRGSKHFAKLRADGSRLVPGVGPDNARIMVIGEAPGAVETDTGVPFTGRSGKLLDRLLALAGVAREDCYLTTVVKYRLPGRQATTAEILRSVRYLRREWMEVKPLVTITLGDSTAAALDVDSSLHGVIYPFWYDEATGVYHKVSSLYHPSFGLKNAKSRKWVEREWQLLGEELMEHAPLALCPDCKGRGPRQGERCFCTGTLAL